MKPFRTITASEMRGVNRTAVLEYVRSCGQTSRAAIAEALEVSLPTVIRIVEELMAEDLIRASGKRAWSGGRKRGLVELNSEEHLTVGLDLSGNKFYGAVADLGGNILYESVFPQLNRRGEDAYESLVELATDMVGFARRTGRTLRGIGVGAPGVTLHEKGMIVYSPSLEWREFMLRDRLEQHFQVPVIVENDVNLAALGELWFGEGQKVNNLVLISIGRGLGAGIIINRALLRGSHEAAGEVGYFMPGRNYLEQKYPAYGAMEMLIAGAGIAERIGKVLPEERVRTIGHQATYEFFFKEVLKETPWALELLDEVIDHLAILVGAVCAFFDPEVVIIGGMIAKSADLFLSQVRSRLEDRIPVVPPIVVSSFGPQATVKGAAINLLYNTADFYVIQKFK